MYRQQHIPVTLQNDRYYKLIGFSLIDTSRQYIGDLIDCIVDDEIPLTVMDTYCWIYSIFTIPNRLNGSISQGIVSPGVASHVHEEDQEKYHKYYEWVCLVLFFQALFFYLPRYLWKSWEAGRLKMLTLDLSCPIISEENKRERLNLLLNYFH